MRTRARRGWVIAVVGQPALVYELRWCGWHHVATDWGSSPWTFRFTEHGLVSWVKRLTDALLKRGDMNVITTDWSDKAKNIDYGAAATASRRVGHEVAELIGFIVPHAPTSEKLFHLVGFSLGAHAAGFAGQYLQQNYGHKLGRISGKNNVRSSQFSKFPNYTLQICNTFWVNYSNKRPIVGHAEMRTALLKCFCLRARHIFAGVV